MIKAIRMNEIIDGNPLVYLDIIIGEEKAGRVVFELFKHVVPKTVENFRALCSGEKGIGLNGKKLHYKGTIFHKAIQHFIIQGGDIIKFDGTGGESIYGYTFEDENFELEHVSGGILSMANAGPNSNSSQFFITIGPCPHLNGHNVVFGKVRKGMGIIKEIGSCITVNDCPVLKCMIYDCGELDPKSDWGIRESDLTEDIYPPWPEDMDEDLCSLETAKIMEIISKIKNSGNHYFEIKNYVDAGRKYKKALRYLDCVSSSESEESGRLNFRKIMHSCLLNLSAVKLKLSQNKDAIELCDKVLASDQTNAKALYRRGQALFRMNEYELALKDLSQALSIVPNDKFIIAELNVVKRAIHKYLAIEKCQCQRMFK